MFRNFNLKFSMVNVTLKNRGTTAISILNFNNYIQKVFEYLDVFKLKYLGIYGYNKL